MMIPEGDLVRSRVETDPGDALAAALDRELTGYAVLEPQDTLLLDGSERGVITFEAGVPVLAYDTRTDSGGADAVADLAIPGPCRVDLYALPAAALAEAHDTPALRVPPGMPATDLAGDSALAERTERAAPENRVDDASDASAVERFLADEDRIEAIRDRARAEAQSRAAEWGLSDQLRGEGEVNAGDDADDGRTSDAH